MVGYAEIASTLVGLVLALLAFMGRDKIGDLKAAQTEIAALKTDVAILKASEVAKTVAEHTTKLQAIEVGLSVIQGDLHFVKQWVERQEKG